MELKIWQSQVSAWGSLLTLHCWDIKPHSLQCPSKRERSWFNSCSAGSEWLKHLSLTHALMSQSCMSCGCSFQIPQQRSGTIRREAVPRKSCPGFMLRPVLAVTWLLGFRLVSAYTHAVQTGSLKLRGLYLSVLESPHDLRSSKLPGT